MHEIKKTSGGWAAVAAILHAAEASSMQTNALWLFKVARQHASLLQLRGGIEDLVVTWVNPVVPNRAVREPNKNDGDANMHTCINGCSARIEIYCFMNRQIVVACAPGSVKDCFMPSPMRHLTPQSYRRLKVIY